MGKYVNVGTDVVPIDDYNMLFIAVGRRQYKPSPNEGVVDNYPINYDIQLVSCAYQAETDSGVSRIPAHTMALSKDQLLRIRDGINKLFPMEVDHD